MKATKKLLTKLYEGVEVAFRTNTATGISEVCIDKVAKFCVWVQVKSGKEYVKYKRVNGFLKELGFSPQVGKGDFIPERIMYPLIGK